MKKIFVLGAGFSKAIANYPLMDDLTKEIRSKLPNFVSVFLQYGFKNFEQSLTYLSTELPWKSDDKIFSDKALYMQTIEEIYQIFWKRAWETNAEKQELYKNYQPLFDYWVQHKDEVAFITFNYDLLLEVLLQYAFSLHEKDAKANEYMLTSPMMYSYPMSWIRSRSEANIADENRRTIPPIIKLHGSVNWFWANQTPSDILFYKNLDKSEYDIDFTTGLKPFIIPPILDKNAFYHHIMIKALWEQAYKLLLECRDIYIIGFSFPATDMSVRFLFQSAIEYRTINMHIINKNKGKQLEDLKENYRTIFTSSQILDFDLCNDEDVVLKLGQLLQEGKI